MKKKEKSVLLSNEIDLYFENFKVLANSLFVAGFLESVNTFEENVIQESFNNELKKINSDVDLVSLLKKIDNAVINNSHHESKALLSVLESKKSEVIATFNMVKDSVFYEKTKSIEMTIDSGKIKSSFNNYFIAFGFQGENRVLTINNLFKMNVLCFDAEYFEISKRFDFLLTSFSTMVSESESIDLSNSTAVEKIIYLNELGIIDFLRNKPEFKSSTNLMATFLSAIAGEKTTTIQSTLNRLINNDIDDKNHPYKSQNTVNKVRQTLIDKNIKPKTS